MFFHALKGGEVGFYEDTFSAINEVRPGGIGTDTYEEEENLAKRACEEENERRLRWQCTFTVACSIRSE